MERPKARWRDSSPTLLVKPSELSKASRLDASFYRAKNVLAQIIQELRHDTEPTIDEFMEAIDFILDYTRIYAYRCQSIHKGMMIIGFCPCRIA